MLRLVLARALRIVVAGLIVGLAGAAGVTRVLQSFLFGVTPTDPIAFTIVTLLLMAVGLMAAWLPARRATQDRPVRRAARGIAVNGSDPSVMGVSSVLRHVGVGDPRRDAFARPVMRVVQVHDQRIQRRLLLSRG